MYANGQGMASDYMKAPRFLDLLAADIAGRSQLDIQSRVYRLPGLWHNKGKLRLSRLLVGEA